MMVLTITCEDGCKFLLHGDNCDSRWEVELLGEGNERLKVVCPHGKSREVGAGQLNGTIGRSCEI